MKRTLSASSFRRIAADQETLIRSCMPRTDARDPRAVASTPQSEPTRAPRVWGIPKTFTLGEVAHV